MSEMKHCKRGGIEGIFVTDIELLQFSDHTPHPTIMDAYIPLPGVPVEEQVKRMATCTDHETTFATGAIEYWERDSGGHGWCCENCGMVLQWG